MKGSAQKSLAKKVFSLLLAAVFALPSSAFAMGSGDKFVDAQTGLTYAVSRPVQTLGLKLTAFQLLVCAPGKEQWIYAKYGTGIKYVEIMETMAGDKCCVWWAYVGFA